MANRCLSVVRLLRQPGFNADLLGGLGRPTFTAWFGGLGISAGMRGVAYFVDAGEEGKRGTRRRKGAERFLAGLGRAWAGV
jgi:hypothetical protein